MAERRFRNTILDHLDADEITRLQLQPVTLPLGARGETRWGFRPAQPFTSRTTRSVISRSVTVWTGLGGPKVWTSIWPSAKNSIS